MNHQEEYISLVKQSLSDNTFIKLSLANYKGSTEGLKNCYIKKIKIKEEDKLSFTYRYQTKDIVKNFSIEEGITLFKNFIENGEFKHTSLFTLEFDAILEYVNKDKIIFKKNNPTHNQLLSLDHNIQKKQINYC